MGRAVVEQPNGMLGIFSSVVDSFVWYDCSDDEYIRQYVKDAKAKALQEAIQNVEMARIHGTTAIYKPFDLRFDEAMELHKEHSGEKLPFEEAGKRCTHCGSKKPETRRSVMGMGDCTDEWHTRTSDKAPTD